MTTESREFKPRKPSFLFQRVVTAMVVCAILSLGVVLAAAALDFLPLIALVPVLCVAIMGPATWGAFVAFRKERYEIHADHLVCHRGSILSDGRTELDIHNVTHVRLRLPFLRHRLFGIGDVRVESAGSAASEITFANIVGPEEVYEEVRQLMKNNGYSLQQSETLHEESPGVVGALTDIVQVGFGGGITGVVLLSIGGGIAADLGMSGGSIASTILVGLGGATVVGALVSGLVGLVVRYLDMTRRTYTVYNDAVAYTEGFLTRDNAFIPFENIADASTTRTVVDQVLGLYDVKVSCQGSGSEILFRRLSRGEQLKAAIGELVANASTAKREEQARVVAAEAEAEAEAEAPVDGSAPPKKRKARASRALVAPEDAWTADFKMNLMRALVGTLPAILIPPAWVIAAGAVFIKASNTTFRIGPDSMASDYSFIGASQQEFAYDKVTGVMIDRNPLDDWFKTVTVHIWSIGSPMPLSLLHIAESDLDLPALLRQCGIAADDPAQGELDQSFGPKVWLIQNAPGLTFLLVLALSSLLTAFVIGPFALLIPPLLLAIPLPMAVATSMRVKRQRVTFHADHVQVRTGWIFRKHGHARYDNIKKVETSKIPLTDQGTLKLYVAGEMMVQQQQGQQQGGGIKIPYSLEAGYVEGITAKVDAVDALMLGVIEPTEIGGEHAQDDDVLSVSRPAVANSIVPLLIIGLFFPPLWLLVPIIAWQVKVRTYSVETDRVVERGGIFFKYAVSVLFDRIDSLQQHQGALGKAFGNGQVTILTAGSSAPDLSVANIPDYQEAYAVIRKHYGKG